MPEWMDKLTQEPLYMIERIIAQVTWGMDRSGLYIIDILDRFRQQLVTQGFTNALNVVSKEVIGVSRPVFELALTTFMLLVIATPIVSFKWVNLKKVLVFAVLIPILLPVLAGGFQDIDAARGDLGSLFYNRIFNNASFTLVPGDEPQGAERAILLNADGKIPPYSAREDGRDGMRGVDVAASYLWATRADVVNPPGALPVAFEQRYFPYDVGTFGAYDTASRWILIEQAGNGITRTIYGLILVTFAFLETLVNLGFTLALGFLLIALVISLIFVWFTPFEGMTITIIKKIVDLFLQSWGISAIQGLTLAAVISAANSGGAVAVLGVGVMGLALEVLFVIVAYKAVITAVTGMGTGSSLSSFEAAPALAPARALAGAAARTPGGVLKTAAAFDSAKAAGASTRYAMGYAMSATRPMAAIGGLATAMGRYSDRSELGAGIFAGQVMARKEPMGVRGLTSMRSDVARRTARDASAAPPPGPTQRPAGAFGVTPNRTIPAAPTPAPPAPRVPLEALAISSAIAGVASRGDAIQGPPSAAVARRLGVTTGAFGAAARPMDQLVQSLQQHPLPAGVAQRLMLEASQEGGFRADSRSQAAALLTQTQGLAAPDATVHLDRLETQMQAMPRAISVEDQARPSVDALMAQSPLLAAAPPSAVPASRPARPAHVVPSASPQTRSAGPTAPTQRMATPPGASAPPLQHRRRPRGRPGKGRTP